MSLRLGEENVALQETPRVQEGLDFSPWIEQLEREERIFITLPESITEGESGASGKNGEFVVEIIQHVDDPEHDIMIGYVHGHLVVAEGAQSVTGLHSPVYAIIDKDGSIVYIPEDEFDRPL